MTFASIMLIMSMISAFVWQTFIINKIYRCTDPVPFVDCLIPQWSGDVEYVTKIEPNQPFKKSTEIIASWNKEGLWCLWLAFFGVPVAVSYVVAIIPQKLGKKARQL